MSPYSPQDRVVTFRFQNKLVLEFYYTKTLRFKVGDLDPYSPLPSHPFQYLTPTQGHISSKK